MHKFESLDFATQIVCDPVVPVMFSVNAPAHPEFEDVPKTAITVMSDVELASQDDNILLPAPNDSAGWLPAHDARNVGLVPLAVNVCPVAHVRESTF